MDTRPIDRASGLSDRSRRVQFGSDLGAARRARRAVTELLGADPFADDVRLVVSELVANVVRHTRGGGVLRLHDERPGGPVLVEVEDSEIALPSTPAVDGGPGGRGLRIVAQLAGRWGIRPTGHGKVVWAELAPPS